MIKKIYFVAGETSGDNHGAALMQALREQAPEIQCSGRGGAKMRAIAGENFRDWTAEAAVVGLWEVIKHYNFFRKEFQRAIAEIEAIKPSAVVFIDYPGFNLRLARALRAKFPELKLIYYISPQVWAWNAGRVTQMARRIDLMLCIFPFEPAIYERAGLRAIFVGHPLAQRGVEVRDLVGDKVRDMNLVALFPGSREREVRKIFPIMLSAAMDLLQRHPNLRFVISAATNSLTQLISAELNDSEKFVVQIGETRELMHRAGVAMVASGTATLEAALAALPFVLVYRVAWLTYFAARLVVKVKHLGMPNVLAGREIVPEFIQQKAQPAQIAAAVEQLLTQPARRSQMLADFREIKESLGKGEANTTAADAIMSELRK